MEVTHERVDTAAAMSASLERVAWDVIIADYDVSGFSGHRAPNLAFQLGGDLPFIFVSGTKGEETAVRAMKAAADDYIVKSDFAWLVPSIGRELQEARGRRQARQSITNWPFRNSDSGCLFESAHEGHPDSRCGDGQWVLDVNNYDRAVGASREHFVGRELWEIGVFKDAENSKAAMATLQKLGRIRYEDLPLEHKSGRHVPVEFVSNVYNEGDRKVIQCNIRDITERKLIEVEPGA